MPCDSEVVGVQHVLVSCHAAIAEINTVEDAMESVINRDNIGNEQYQKAENECASVHTELKQNSAYDENRNAFLRLIQLSQVVVK